MIKEHLQSINGVEIYAIVGFLIFFIFFILITIHTIKLRKEQVSRHSQLPLDEELSNWQE